MAPVRFNPVGSLDIASDPSDLPEDVTSVLTPGKFTTSGAMTRCTNLDLDQAGIARTRRGSGKLHNTAINTKITRIIEQSGTRYAFAGDSIYKDEISIGTGFSEAAWSAILYNSYATTVQSVFALNGTDRKRITDSDIFEWGSESPTVAPILSLGTLSGLTGEFNAKYTWVRKEGSTIVWESNPSPAAAAPIILVDGSFKVIFDLPTDTQMTHVRVYRTLTTGAVYYYQSEYTIDWSANIATTTYEWSYIYDWELYYI
jgi:hypothetical protein